MQGIHQSQEVTAAESLRGTTSPVVSQSPVRRRQDVGHSEMSASFVDPIDCNLADQDEEANATLMFKDVQDAEAFMEVRVPVGPMRYVDDGTPAEDDLDMILRDQPSYILDLRDAFSRPISPTPSGANTITYDDKTRKRLTEWQLISWNRYQWHEQSSVELPQLIEARMWSVLKEAIAVHRHGYIQGMPFEAALTCSERLAKVCEVLSGFMCVRADFIEAASRRLNILFLVAAPMAFAETKMQLFYTWMEQHAESPSVVASVVRRAQTEAEQQIKIGGASAAGQDDWQTEVLRPFGGDQTTGNDTLGHQRAADGSSSKIAELDGIDTQTAIGSRSSFLAGSEHAGSADTPADKGKRKARLSNDSNESPHDDGELAQDAVSEAQRSSEIEQPQGSTTHPKEVQRKAGGKKKRKGKNKNGNLSMPEQPPRFQSPLGEHGQQPAPSSPQAFETEEEAKAHTSRKKASRKEKRKRRMEEKAAKAASRAERACRS